MLAIEHCLIRKLPSLFTPKMVYDLDDEDVNRLAAESNGASSDRARCSEKLGILETGLQDLKRLNKHRAITSVKGTFFSSLYPRLLSTSP